MRALCHLLGAGLLLGGQEHNRPGTDGQRRYRSLTVAHSGKVPGEEEKVWALVCAPRSLSFQWSLETSGFKTSCFPKWAVSHRAKSWSIFMNYPFCLLTEWLQQEEMRLILILLLVWRLGHSFGKKGFRILGAEEGSRNQLSHFTGHFSHVCPWAKGGFILQFQITLLQSPQVLIVLLLSTTAVPASPSHQLTVEVFSVFNMFNAPISQLLVLFPCYLQV